MSEKYKIELSMKAKEDIKSIVLYIKKIWMNLLLQVNMLKQ